MHKPNWINPVKKSGLALFVFSFITFIAILFVNQYSLNKQVLQDSIGDQNHRNLVQAKFESLFDQAQSKFSFINTVNQIFEDHNANAFSNYSISKTDIQALISESKTQGDYNANVITTVFNAQNAASKDVIQFKSKKLSDYTNWLFDQGKPTAEIQQVLEEKAADINKSIEWEKRIDSYRVGIYAFAIVKNASSNTVANNQVLFFFLTIVLGTLGALMYIVPQIKEGPAGIKNNGVYQNSATNGGWLGLVVFSFLILFYVAMYFFPEYISEWVSLINPLSLSLSGNSASHWFVYGFLYTLSMTVMGIRMAIKYRHNNYQLARTFSVVFFQSCFAFILPEILTRLNQPSLDLKNMWPLDYSFFDAYKLDSLTSTGDVGLFMLVWGLTLFLIGVPLFTYFFGKRWYCSWVCGCGGLAETLGDPYRQLSNKSTKAWQIERITIHSVLVFSIIMTIGVLYTYFTDIKTVFGIETSTIRTAYGFYIGAIFSGVIGTGFYPKMGNRVWCRFGCPLAAYIGIIQRFKSRFRITTNGAQCISCGNCSTYCEMGIDVRAYAQRGEDIVRASCVGCGVCSAVCPRGVLKLENGNANSNSAYKEQAEQIKIKAL